MRNAVRVVGIGLLLSGLLVCAASGQPAGASPAVEAARQRQASVRSVTIEFRVTEDVAEGAVSATMPLSPKAVPGRVVPPKATKLESTNKLVISGNKTRYECNHPVWTPDTGELSTVGFINTMDGEYDKLFYPIGINKPDQPEGFIGRTAISHDIKSYLIAPLTLWYRGLEPSITPYVVIDFRPTGTVTKIRGRECPEYVRTGSKSTQVFIWFDPSAGYSPRRFRIDNKQGKPREQVDIDARSDASNVWVPVSWVRSEYAADGRVLFTTKGDVVSTRLNEVHPDSTFEIQFPPRTRLYNAREQKTYIIQNDGTMREFDPATGKVSSDTVYQPGTSWLVRNQMWLVTGVALVMLLSIVWYVRRRRQVS